MSFFKLLWRQLCRFLSLLGLCRRRRYDLVSPVVGVADAWVRPGEILVDVNFEGEIAEELTSHGGRLYRPNRDRGAHGEPEPDNKDWRQQPLAPWYGDINARMDEVGLGFHLWVGFSTRRVIKLVKKYRPRGVCFNTVYLGEGYYQGGPGGRPDPVGAPTSFPTAVGGGPVDVAVLDNGMPKDWETKHPGLANAVTLAGNILFAGDPVDENLDGVLDNQAGHGLFICGLIARRHDELNIELRRLLHATGETEDTLAATALTECTAQIVNMSFGGFTTDDVVAPVMANAVTIAVGRDQVLVAAAGNDGGADAGSEFHEREFWPAALPEVISVGACDPTDLVEQNSLWAESNRAQIYAPGVMLRSTYVTDWQVPGTVPAEMFLGWAAWSGTSFAAPVVAAEIAHEFRTSPPAGSRRTAADLWVAKQESMKGWPGKNATSGDPTRFAPDLSGW